MQQLIVSVGREFGTGGHEIAERLAKRLNLPFYDRDLLREIANDLGVSATDLAQYDEMPRNHLMSRTVRGYTSSPEHNVAEMQFQYLRNMAEEGKSFVIVGRCAEEKLKPYPALISIFVLGDQQAKLERISRVLDISLEEAKKVQHKQDKRRKTYHNSYCEGKWGDSRNYDISINSSRISQDRILELLEFYIQSRLEAREKQQPAAQ